MKLLKHFGLVLLSSFLAIGAAIAQDAAGTTPGSIKIGQITGTVNAVNPTTGEVTALTAGSVVTAPLTVVTGGESSALLILSNGATLEVLAGSRVEIPLFNQAPFDSSLGSFLDLQSDPSASHVQVNVVSGSVAVIVPQLNSSSTFFVSTPTGGAEVNNAVVVVDYDAQTGNTEIANVSGTVNTTNAAGVSTPLPVGQTLTVTGQIDPATGNASAASTSVAPNSPATIAKAETAQQATSQAAGQQAAAEAATVAAETTPVVRVDASLIDPSTTIPE